MSLAVFAFHPEKIAAVVLVWMEKPQHHEGVYYSRHCCAAGVESSSLHLVALRKSCTETPKTGMVVQPLVWRETDGMEWCGIR